MDYMPEAWVVLKVEGHKYKVFGAWRGAYLSSDNWRLNSGIVSAKVDGDYVIFEGASGSKYTCHLNGYGVKGSWLSSVIDNFVAVGAEVMDQETDWENVEW